MIDRLEKEVELLKRHFRVLELVIDNEPIGIVQTSDETGYPHHKVRYSLRMLEEEGLIEPSSRGAVTTDRTAEFVDGLAATLDETAARLESMRIDAPAGTAP